MSDQAETAQALEHFLHADPEQWPRLAPRIVAAVGDAQLRGVVEATRRRGDEATRERPGDFTGVRESPDGLVIERASGRVLALARSDAGGILVNLRIASGPYRPARPRIPPGGRGAGGPMSLVKSSGRPA